MQFILSPHLNNEEIIVFSILGLNCCAIDKVLIDLKYEKTHALLWYNWLRPLGTLPGFGYWECCWMLPSNWILCLVLPHTWEAMCCRPRNHLIYGSRGCGLGVYIHSFNPWFLNSALNTGVPLVCRHCVNPGGKSWINHSPWQLIHLKVGDGRGIPTRK